MSIEAMKQALAVLEEIADEVSSPYDNKLGDAILALRAAIEQAEKREPKIQALIGSRARLQIELSLIKQLLDDPEFETTILDMEYWRPLHDRLKERLAPRQWQGLTLFDKVLLRTTHAPMKELYYDKETDCSVCAEVVTDWENFFTDIEAKLKEKNT